MLDLLLSVVVVLCALALAGLFGWGAWRRRERVAPRRYFPPRAQLWRGEWRGWVGA